VESLTVETFVAPNRRQRWLDGLADRRLRMKVLSRLAHSDDFIERLARPLHVSGRREEQVRALHQALLERGAPPECHILSADDEIDGRLLPLPDAIEACIDDGGALLICIPERLALHLPEAPAEPVLLEVG
jgi:hypothetical protein